MRAVIIGEAWGRQEAQFYHALVGPSGRELTLEMGAANLAPYMNILCRKCKTFVPFAKTFCPKCSEYIWPNEFTLIDHWKRLRLDHQIAVTNVFNARPPDNDLGHFFGTEPETPMPGWKASRKTGGSHLKAEFFPHLERLWAELRELRPNLIIALGNTACWATLRETKISQLRGTINWSESLQTKVLPTFHPANVLRPQGRSMRPIVIADLMKASRELDFPEVRRPERWITVVDPSEAGIREIAEWTKRPAITYANDIETYAGQITIVGFARSPSDALVIPFRNENNPDNPNYWPTADLEVQAWKGAIRLLESPQPKIFQNGMYDLTYYLKMGIQPRNCLHDTMLWHHAKYPELPKSLGFLGSLYSNDIAWKQMRRSATLKRDE